MITVEQLDALLAAVPPALRDALAALDDKPRGRVRNRIRSRLARIEDGLGYPHERGHLTPPAWRALTGSQRLAYAAPAVVQALLAEHDKGRLENNLEPVTGVSASVDLEAAPTPALTRYTVECRSCDDVRPARGPAPVSGGCPNCVNKRRAREAENRTNRAARRLA